MATQHWTSKKAGAAQTVVTSEQDTLLILQRGEISAEGLTRYGSNYTFLVKVAYNGDERLAIYKPRDGEAPLWDFPRGTLYKREYAAYLLSRILDWGFIPLTIIRDGPHGIGSLQLFIEHDPRSSYYTVKDDHPDALRTISLFDLLANNADRKPGHCILGDDGKVWSIDHGLTFNANLKVRTVIWDFGEEPIPDTLMRPLKQFVGQLLNPQGRVKELLSLLDRDEAAALTERTTWLVKNRAFPGLYRRR